MTSGQFSPPSHLLHRWTAILIVLVVALLALNFNARLATIQQMRQEETRLRQAVAKEEARQIGLKSLQAYVASDDYVEHWARVEARMIKPGEIPVIPIAARTAQVEPGLSPPARVPATILEEWWMLFFGETPAIP